MATLYEGFFRTSCRLFQSTCQFVRTESPRISAIRSLRKREFSSSYVSLLPGNRNQPFSTFGGEEMVASLDNPRILITGSLGQLGQGLAKMLRSKYGRDNVLMSDIVKPPRHMLLRHAPYIYIDVLDMNSLQQAVVNYHIDWIVHFSAILSATGEQNVPLALKINIDGLHNVLEVAKQYALRIFIPSTIGAFGPSSPKVNTPDLAIQRPTTIYGVSKVHCELLGEYYHHRFGLDFRCLRFPGIISADTNPGGGTTDYAVKIFHDALNSGRHECYLRPNTRLPMMYIDDCLRSVVRMLESPEDTLKLRTYNVAALSFTPEEIAKAIKQRLPMFDVAYNICSRRQTIADSWPESFDDSNARQDWGWSHGYDMDRLVDTMLKLIREQKASQSAPVVEVENKPMASHLTYAL